jgi:hypothetical protein
MAPDESGEADHRARGLGAAPARRLRPPYRGRSAARSIETSRQAEDEDQHLGDRAVQRFRDFILELDLGERFRKAGILLAIGTPCAFAVSMIFCPTSPCPLATTRGAPGFS